MIKIIYRIKHNFRVGTIPELVLVCTYAYNIIGIGLMVYNRIKKIYSRVAVTVKVI